MKKRSGALSNREVEVAKLLSVGLSGPDIAKQLGISPKTMDSHRTHILEKLGVHRVILVPRELMRLNLMTFQEWDEMGGEGSCRPDCKKS